MSMIEDRLRRDLPALADALIDSHRAGPAGAAPGADPLQRPPTSDLALLAPAPTSPARRAGGHPPRRRRLAAMAAAFVVTAGAGGLAWAAAQRDTTAPDNVITAAGPVERPGGWGTWTPIPEAPIDPRPFAVSAWTGSEAVFWAGASIDRGFAHSDGAAYDPATGTWRDLEVPGWGHPGLTSTFLDGQIYVVAKGGAMGFDPATGTWFEIPEVEGMLLAAIVATDDAVWGLGPPSAKSTLSTGAPTRLFAARYEPDADRWAAGPALELTPDRAPIANGLAGLESTVGWTGAEIVVWHPAAGGAALDPSTGAWRSLAELQPPAGELVDSTVAWTDAGLVAVSEIAHGEGSHLAVARLDASAWTWLDVELPVAGDGQVTVAPASDWIIAFSVDQPPITVHVPSGAWTRHVDGPLAGLTAPNTVWTGEQLIVWGGLPQRSAGEPAPPDGAVWTPPPA